MRGCKKDKIESSLVLMCRKNIAKLLKKVERDSLINTPIKKFFSKMWNLLFS